MYGLWGYLLKAILVLVLINARRVLEGEQYYKLLPCKLKLGK